MRLNNWVKIGLVAAVFAIGAMADHGDNNPGNNNGGNNNANNNGNGMFSSSIVGSVPGVTIAGVKSGGAPWTIGEGRASVSSNGRVEVEVQGLLIMAGAGVPPNLVGTVGPVQMVAASVVCGGSGGTVAATTAPVVFSSMGNAEVHDTVTLPATCVAPVVLIRIFSPTAAPGSQVGAFIASSGFAAMTGNVSPGDDNSGDH